MHYVKKHGYCAVNVGWFKTAVNVLEGCILLFYFDEIDDSVALKTMILQMICHSSFK